MRKLLLPLAAAMSLTLTGCSSMGTSTGSVITAPLNQTVMDEKALIYAWRSYDTVLTLVDKSMEAGIIVPGSPRALRIRTNLIRVRDALRAASAARRAGSVADFNLAFDEANSALLHAQAAIKE